MNFREYQEAANSTAVYPNQGKNFIYPCLGLAGEAGEVCEKFKKLIRDSNSEVTAEFKETIKKELGDVLWYLAAISNELGFTLETVAETNIQKLFSRKEREVLHGSGDER